jgi:hypothetical protein
MSGLKIEIMVRNQQRQSRAIILEQKNNPSPVLEQYLFLLFSELFLAFDIAEYCVVPFHCFFNQNFTGNNFRKYYIDCQKISNLFGQALETGRMRFAFLACFPARANKIYIY